VKIKRSPSLLAKENRLLFFFNVSGSEYDPDVDGLELPSISEARIMAVQFLGETLRDRPEDVWSGDEIRVEVTDTDQRLLFTVVALGVDAPASA
jgi:hypothetical protein